MAEDGRLTSYKAALSRQVQRVRELLATARTKSIGWAHRGGPRIRAWVGAGSVRLHAVAHNGAQRGLAFLQQHLAGLKATAGLMVLAVALLALWKIPQWQVADQTLTVKERLELQDKARGTLAQIIGGMVVLVGLYFTGRSAAAAWRNVQVTQEGQITERFTRAIDQLGSNKRAIRLGGIYALERIARDSAKDYWPIMEVLTAYVREHAPWKDTTRSQGSTTQESEEPTLEKGVQQETPQSTPKPAADIQAILTVLGRRTRWYGHGEDQPLDLRKTNLEGASLRGVHLEGVLLSGAHLKCADLSGAHLQPADLSGTDLQHARLHNAHLEYADLSRAHLEHARLHNAHLEHADLSRAHLEHARLHNAHLEHADLSRAHLEHADLSRAHLEHARLLDAYLEGANLLDAHLEGAILLYATGLTKEQLAFAIIDERTRLPDYLTT